MSPADTREARIPKRIHYCWFGGQPLSADAQAMIATWRRFCPDYEIIEWNESNFDINENDYVREAYEAKKWAFVTDYVRLKALYEQGGFYMDTDVEVVKSLDPLRVYDAVSGYESETCIPTGTIGACRDNEWIGMLLRDYDNRHFVQLDGSYDTTTNVVVITRLTSQRYCLELDGTIKQFGNNMILLPFEYLCAKNYQTGKVMRTDNTYTIHHFNGSWLSEDESIYLRTFQVYYEKIDWASSSVFRHKLAALITVYHLHGMDGVFSKIIKYLKSRL